MQAFDKLWNYNDPATTEIKFREVLPDYSMEKNRSGFLQLNTQIARTYSLRQMFDEAHDLLNEVEQQLPATTEVAHVRYHLERGRTFQASGKKVEARIEFERAKAMAEELEEDFYTLDALHMLAIAAPTAQAIALNEEAVLKAETSVEPPAKNWLGALYNNLAWAYFDKEEYEKALSIFLRALKWREGKQSEREIFIAKWCVGRTLRALNKIEQAITIQLGLLEEMVNSDRPDGYVYEELAELYLVKGEEVHKMYFRFAYNTLVEDAWLSLNEKARLNRMLELSK